MHFLDLRTEIKSLDQGAAGTFVGLAAAYNNVDQGGDVLQRGCFKAIEATSDGCVRLLDSHQHHRPIGKARIQETDAGLAVKGTLNLSVSHARDVHELLKDGTVGGLSIGFQILPDGSETKANGTRLLKALRLFEISTVCFPMNTSATISHVKSAGPPTDVRGFEMLLKEVGFSNRDSKKLASRGWAALIGDEPEDPAERIAERLDEMTAMLRGGK